MSDEDEVPPMAQNKVQKAVGNFASIFGEEVRQHRTNLHLTQKELTLALRRHGIKVTQTYISRLEAGQRKNPSAQLTIALAALLSISLDKVVSTAQETES